MPESIGKRMTLRYLRDGVVREVSVTPAELRA
jgi:hypothetical protein